MSMRGAHLVFTSVVFFGSFANAGTTPAGVAIASPDSWPERRHGLAGRGLRRAGRRRTPASRRRRRPTVDPSKVPPEDMPTAVRMRRLEQKTQALKERAWQLKARVQMLKEQMLGGGVGAQSVITHESSMGVSFRMTKLIYALDGTEVFVRTDDTAESLYKAKSFDVFAGPISPGNHNVSAVATYRGHGYGVFEYLDKYSFTAKGNNSFVAGEGKISKVECRGYEKGGPTVPLEKRAAIDCKVSEVMPDKPAAAPTTTNPGTTPLPTSTGGGSAAAPGPNK